MRNGLGVAALVAALAAAAWAQERGKEGAMAAKLVEVGAEAPDFRLNDQAGRAVRLSALRKGGWVVLAFYPKALTGG